MLRLIFWIFILYLVYKFVFDLLIPTSNATVQMRDKIREMQNEQQRMQQQMNQQRQQQNQPTQVKPTCSQPSKDDYIDFEEIKK